MSAQEEIGIAIAVVVFGSPIAAWLIVLANGARHQRARLKEHARANRAHYAAVEAAEDEPIFSPDAIDRSVTEIVTIADTLWRTGRSRALADRPDAGLIRAWAFSRQSWLSNALKVRGKPSVDLLQVINRGNKDEDRVVVRVRVRLHCKDPELLLSMRYVHLDERWTLERGDAQWALISVDGDPFGGPVLTAPLVPTPASDTERLREESLAEMANAQKVGPGVALSDLVSPDEPPALALPDLSVVDGRFAPGLIAAQLAHLLETWENAVTGSEAPLERLATAEARAALLRPEGRARFVIRDAVLKSWEPTRLDLSHQPPAIEVALDVEAVRYVVTDDSGHRVGEEDRARRMKLAWTLELSDSAATPWRLAKSNNPALAIPGWP